ncbi:hypothetical protein niasHT_030961 [Heterodera trifolii]|uniref:Uncharacterized protein n=1 Tax=Heterodera trifolii TaxID=157864 RepID=A0ABD2J8I6_9BILA
MLIAVDIGLCSVINAIAEAVIINHHPALKRRFIYLFDKFFSCHGHGQVSDSFVTNTTTKSTNADIIHGFNEHFKMLELQWK